METIQKAQKISSYTTVFGRGHISDW